MSCSFQHPLVRNVRFWTISWGLKEQVQKKEAYTTNVRHNLRRCDGVTLKHWVTFMPPLHNTNGSNNLKNQQWSGLFWSCLACSGRVVGAIPDWLHTKHTLAQNWLPECECGLRVCICTCGPVRLRLSK